MQDRNNNFDIFRLVAALLVIISHSFGILNKGRSQPIINIIGIELMPSSLGLFIFFVISGYLVMQSLDQSRSPLHYLKKRMLRIYPALIACNIICILFLGIFFCSLSLKQYLFNIQTWTYLWYNTALYRNQFYLPGVFNNLRPANEVNASLWTLGVEIGLYIILLLLSLLRLFKSKIIFAFAFTLFILSSFFLHHKTAFGWPLEYYINLFIFFFEGIALYIFKDQILKWYWLLLLIMAIFLIKQSWAQWLLLTFTTACLIIFIARLRSFISLKGMDVSYGLYIYAFPVQQILLIFLGGSINPWIHFLLTLLCTFPLAFASWRWVEKPMLKLKNL